MDQAGRIIVHFLVVVTIWMTMRFCVCSLGAVTVTVMEMRSIHFFKITQKAEVEDKGPPLGFVPRARRGGAILPRTTQVPGVECIGRCIRRALVTLVTWILLS